MFWSLSNGSKHLPLGKEPEGSYHFLDSDLNLNDISHPKVALVKWLSDCGLQRQTKFKMKFSHGSALVAV